MKEEIVTGRTVEEAMTAATEKFGATEASYEILELPKKGFLGFGSSPAKIKVSIGDPESDKKAEKKEQTEKQQPKYNPMSNLARPVGQGQGKKKKKPQPSVKNTTQPQPVKSDVRDPSDNRRRSRPGNDRRRSDGKSDSGRSGRNNRRDKDIDQDKSFEDVELKYIENPKGLVDDGESKVIEITEEEKDATLSLVNAMLKDMELSATAAFEGNKSTSDGGNTYPRMVITGEESGILIGHHGDTLDAIQYLVNLCANRKSNTKEKEFVKIIVDIENYRAKREDTLRNLAKRAAQKSIKYKKNVAFEPMNPYERRIIHSEIQHYEGVATHSVGTDDNRRVIVTFEGFEKKEEQ